VKPRLLDLFCGAGGASMGYHRAGFDVVGVDLNPAVGKRYPFEFHTADALDVLFTMLASPTLPDWLADVIAVHLSPPCQDYSVTASLHTAEYPRLIGPVRDFATAIGLPYIIENVEGARRDMLNPIKLCGSSFGLGVRRHRLFETNWPIAWPPMCAHYLQPEPIDVTGTGGRRKDPRSGTRHPGGGDSRKPLNLAHAREVMGIDWMSRAELAESIPPAYTQFIGEQLLAHITERAA
jgi:DNA (cytosine-5)-methyltransferase 1